MSLFAAIALLAAAPAARDDPNSIIVTGTPDAEREERKRAAEFVRRTGVAALTPVARWIVPVCPRTIGVDAKVAGIVDDRIRDVAEAAGAPIAPKPCTPNIAVIFTDDGDGLTRAIFDKSPRAGRRPVADRTRTAGARRRADPLVVRHARGKPRRHADEQRYTQTI